MDVKSLFSSKTIWGVIVAALGHSGALAWLSSHFGFPPPQDTVFWVNLFVGLSGDLLAAYGRLVANSKLSIFGKKPGTLVGGNGGFVRIRLLSLIAAVLLSSTLLGCASVKPQTPAQSVYSLQGSYTAALTAAIAYKKLPPCSAVVVAVCSKPDVVAKLQKADDVAFSALTAAQNTVRNPNAGLNADTAIKAANEALVALMAITNTLGVK